MFRNVTQTNSRENGNLILLNKERGLLPDRAEIVMNSMGKI